MESPFFGDPHGNTFVEPDREACIRPSERGVEKNVGEFVASGLVELGGLTGQIPEHQGPAFGESHPDTPVGDTMIRQLVKLFNGSGQIRIDGGLIQATKIPSDFTATFDKSTQNVLSQIPVALGKRRRIPDNSIWSQSDASGETARHSTAPRAQKVELLLLTLAQILEELGVEGQHHGCTFAECLFISLERTLEFVEQGVFLEGRRVNPESLGVPIPS